MVRVLVAALVIFAIATPASARYRYLSRTAVVYEGKIVGQDPDPRIRIDFKKNGDFYAGGQP
jgi:hypothetical protein